MPTETVYLVSSPERYGESDVEFPTLNEARQHVADLYHDDGDRPLLMRMPSVLQIFRVERELLEEVEHPLMGGVRRPTVWER